MLNPVFHALFLMGFTQKWVCLKIGKTPKPNGFADHYPYEKWLAIIRNINTTFSDKPILMCIMMMWLLMVFLLVVNGSYCLLMVHTGY